MKQQKGYSGIIPIIIGLIIISVITSYITVILTKDKVEEDIGKQDYEFIHYASDLVGSKSATTTTPAYFQNNYATTTAIRKISGDIAIYTIQAVTASSTGVAANVIMSFLGSNDDFCNTATSTVGSQSTADVVLTGDINWFDIGDHLKDKVHSTSLSSATSTLTWSDPITATGKEIILTDLAYECLRLDVSASGTALWIQLRTN